MSETVDHGLNRRVVEEWLRSRGADRLDHLGGTLYKHVCRVATLLAEWSAHPVLEAAGLCHACYGTDGFPHALLELSKRSALAELIGAEAERLVYLDGSCDRAAVYPRLADLGPVRFEDRFTGDAHAPAEADVRAFVELTAANEFDVLVHNPGWPPDHGDALFDLIASARHRLSEAGWRAWVQRLGPQRSTEGA